MVDLNVRCRGLNVVHGGPRPPPLPPLLAHGTAGAPLLQHLLPIAPTSRAAAPLPATSDRHHATVAHGQHHKALRVLKAQESHGKEVAADEGL
jgi:hypothetical protein